MNLELDDTYTLLERLKRSDENAVRKVYLETFHYCASFVLKNEGDIEDARNIFQESLLALFKNLRKKDFALQAPLKSYLYGITKNLWLKKLRKDKKTGLRLIIDDSNSDFQLEEKNDEGGEYVKEEQLQRLEKALNEHSEDCKQVLRHFFYEKKNYREVAQNMGYSETYIRKKKMKCIETLRKKMEVL